MSGEVGSRGVSNGIDWTNMGSITLWRMSDGHDWDGHSWCGRVVYERRGSVGHS